MARVTDWRKALTGYLRAAGRTAYAPGQHDCALFAAGAVVAMTGRDYAAPYRGRYTTIRGGLRVLRKDGYADHIALAAAHLPEVAVARARPGDLAVVESQDGPALGVVQGEAVYVLLPDRLGLVSLMAVKRVFEV